MVDVVAFDADDTLWENETLYLKAKGAFAQILSSYRDRDWIIQKLDETESANIQVFGYGIKSFTLSMIETAAEAVEGTIEARTVSAILEIAKGMLSADVKLLDHSEQTLMQLSPDYTLMLVTKGDLFEQQQKIAHSGIAHYFKLIEVVAEKNPASYITLLANHQIEAERFMMVGNSLRSDILPVLEIGGRAVYIPNAYTWSHEVPDQEEIAGAEYDELEHLGQLPGYLANLQ